MIIGHKSHKNFTYFAIFISSCSAMFMNFFIPVIFLFLGISQDLRYFEMISYICQNLLRLFFTCQLILASLAVKARFRLLNIHLKKTIKMKNNCKNIPLKNFKASDYSNLYHKLCDAINVINNTFTFPFIVIFPVLMVNCLKFENMSSI